MSFKGDLTHHLHLQIAEAVPLSSSTHRILSLETLLQHTATHTTALCTTLQHTAPHFNTLQHTATHCNTLQHTANTSFYIFLATSTFCLSANERCVPAKGPEYIAKINMRIANEYAMCICCNAVQCVAVQCSVLCSCVNKSAREWQKKM